MAGALGSDAWLVRTDSLGRTRTSAVEGTVFADAEDDCIFSANDWGLADLRVRVEGPKDTVNAVTDGQGHFRFVADTGLHTIKILPTTDLYTLAPCAIDSFSVVLGLHDTASFEFAHWPDTILPKPHVVGLDELVYRQGEIKVVPNPFSSVAQLVLPDLPNHGLVQVAITDVSGRVVQLLREPVSRAISLNRDGLEAGIYLYRVTFESRLIGTGKMLVR